MLLILNVLYVVDFYGPGALLLFASKRTQEKFKSIRSELFFLLTA